MVVSKGYPIIVHRRLPLFAILRASQSGAEYLKNASLIYSEIESQAERVDESFQ